MYALAEPPLYGTLLLMGQKITPVCNLVSNKPWLAIKTPCAQNENKFL